MSLHQRLRFHALSLPHARTYCIYLLVPATPGWVADLKSYFDADQKLVKLYCQSRRVGTQGNFECGCVRKFSSDRTIVEYAKEIWNG
ncbi:MAG: glycogen/starch/alpha-glucan phosphorylase [Limisphaerales bacterium]